MGFDAELHVRVPRTMKDELLSLADSYTVPAGQVVRWAITTYLASEQHQTLAGAPVATSFLAGAPLAQRDARL